jgi:hypothetical protein
LGVIFFDITVKEVEIKVLLWMIKRDMQHEYGELEGQKILPEKKRRKAEVCDFLYPPARLTGAINNI